MSLAANINTLPPLPTVALRILERFGDEFIDGNEVADIIEKDPGISGKLLGVANSAYFSLREPTTEMRDVVNRVLGAEHVRTLAFGLATSQMFDTGRCKSFDTAEFWQRALFAANTCRRVAAVAEPMTAAERESAFVLGLCHRLGLLALAFLKPEELDALLANRAANDELDQSISDAFGESVQSLTAALARHWKMPEMVVQVYDELASPGCTENTSLLCEVVLTATAVADVQIRRSLDPEVELPDDPEWIAERAAVLGTVEQRLEEALRLPDAMLGKMRASATALSG